MPRLIAMQRRVLAETMVKASFVTHPLDPKRREGEPRVFIGPIASGNTLLRDPAIRDRLREDLSAKAIEMEASGVADASWINEINYFVVRGTCDYCDGNKNDIWQKYAAIIAAAYTKALLASIVGPLNSALFWAFWAGEFMLTLAGSQVAREGGMDLGSPGGDELAECLDRLRVQTCLAGGITDELRTKVRLEIEQRHGQDAGEAFQLGWVTNLAAVVCNTPSTLNAVRHEIETICHRIGVPKDIMELYLPILERPAPDRRQVLASLDLFKKRLLAWLDAKVNMH